MHAVFKVGQSEIMASDGCSTEESAFKGFSLSIALEHEADADRYFKRPVGRREGSDASNQNLLVAAFRDVGEQVRSCLDD